MIDRIALVTDFGGGGPYLGQMKLRLSELAPRMPVIDLISDLEPFRPDLAAYFLPALARDMPVRTLYLCVVDPGVGGKRNVVAVEADGDWYIGPDNGLLALVARRAKEVQVVHVEWRPEQLSDSFHGRDLFCPLAVKLAAGDRSESVPLDLGALVGSDWPDDSAKVIYADRYGNLITGIRARNLGKSAGLQAGGREIFYARTFCEVSPGQAFWYEDSIGLVELAINQGNACLLLGLGLGDRVWIS